MNEEYLGPLISKDDMISELRRRKNKDTFKSVSASTKKLIAEKVRGIRSRTGLKKSKN
jgi:hypothetical protein